MSVPRTTRASRGCRVLCTLLASTVFLSLGAPYAARAQEPDAPRYASEPLPEAVAHVDVDRGGVDVPVEDLDPETVERVRAAASQSGPSEPPIDASPLALPIGDAKSAVSPTRISLPNAEGSIEGMGESFSPVLSSGTGSFSVPIAVTPGRNGVQPSLALSYSTSGGNGPVGVGWNLGVPMITRQTDRGLPRYRDDLEWAPDEDHFIYNGGQELVPVDNDAIAAVDASGRGYATSAVPNDVVGWQQYRARIEGGFMRFFREPAGRRWVVQSKDGSRFDFGELPVSEAPSDLDSRAALQSELPGGEGRVAAWCLTRMSDAHGSTVYYRYLEDGGARYLLDVHYLSPGSCAAGGDSDAQRRCSAPLSQYGARVHLHYESRPDVFVGYTTTWKVERGLRLAAVTVTAAEETVGQRYFVRRYHLSYDPASFHSLLASVQVEGRPDEYDPTVGARIFRRLREEDAGDVGTVGGATLPPMTFGYTGQPTGGRNLIPGFGGLNARATPVPSSPDVSVDAARADLFDVNTDGLPDLIVTDPATYRTADDRPAMGVFFNGFEGADAAPAGRTATFSAAIPVPMRGDLSGVMNLANANIVPMDVEGDGRSDLLHMPRLDRYGFFTPSRANASGDLVRPSEQGWAMTYAEVALPELGADPRIDFVRDGGHYRVLDVNGDHLIDVVKTTGTEMQTWLNLGWVPGGEGRFGQAFYVAGDPQEPTSWQLTTEPIASCILHAGRPVDFSDRETRLADMNGDGLVDLVRLRRGDLVYWPARGPGLFGDGPATCLPGAASGREIRVINPPAEINVELSGVHLSDVNSDGAADVVQVRFNQVDVWFNQAGRSFTERTWIDTPPAPDFSPNVRFADLDGSGTLDIVYGNARRWEFVDFMGGQRPRLLDTVENGLGARTVLTYDASSQDYVADLKDADDCATGSASGTCQDVFTWNADADGCDARLQELSGECVYRSGGSPVISTVVRASSVSDQFHLVGREENVMVNRFAYHDGYYEGIEQEFRGFGAADSISEGDDSQPSLWTRTFFHQGRRPDSIATDRLADNPYEALKGRQFLAELFDEHGRYLSTSHGTVRVRELATGRDGRRIWYAYVSQSHQLLYDTDPATYASSAASVPLPHIERETVGSGGAAGGATVESTFPVPVRATRWAATRATTDEVDNLGHVVRSTAHGRVKETHDPAMDAVDYDERIVSHLEPTDINGAGQWIWRTRRGYVTGQRDGGQRIGDGTTEFDLRGNALMSRQLADLPTSRPSGYDFGALTQADQILEASTAYDDWGNPSTSCAGGDLRAGAASCLRYSEVTYEPAYAQLPIRESLAVDTSEGSHCDATAPFCMLETSATYERGLALVLSATDPNEQTTAMGFDGLGRVSFARPPPVDGCESSTVPTQRFGYELAQPGRPLSAVTAISELDCSALGAETIESRFYMDGLGRSRAGLTRAERDGWEQTGVAIFNRRGAARFAYQPAFTGALAADPTWEEAVAIPSVPRTEVYHDAFGRPVRALAEDGSPTVSVYHALATDVWDVLDLGGDLPFSGTYATTRVDGHGRTIDQVLRQRQLGAAATEHYRLFTEYRADGALLRITRGQTADDGWVPAAASAVYVPDRSGRPRHVERTFTYDTVGRRIGTTDPDTDSRTNPDPRSSTWRYLFNDIGDLAAVRDPRGCGQDFFYDRAGRLIGEGYVSCAEAQPAGDEPFEVVPPGSIGLGALATDREVEARYHFDAAPFWASDIAAPPAPNHLVGRLTASSDRGQRSVVRYDPRGQVTWTARQMALLPQAPGVTERVGDSWQGPIGIEEVAAPNAGTILYDEVHSYAASTRYDHGGRAVASTLPIDPDWEGEGPAPVIGGRITYNARGLPSAVWADIGGTRQGIVDSLVYARDRLVEQITYGDDAGGTRRPTVSSTRYDARRRPVVMRTERQGDPATPERRLNEVTEPFHQRYEWDQANNLVRIRDARIGAEWPEGYRPPLIDVMHDALYRVAQVDYRYRRDDDRYADGDGATDWRDARHQVADDGLSPYEVDPMRREPAPMVPALPDQRVANLMYEYDWLANMTQWVDDAGAFHERSLGEDIGNGFDEAGLRPSALHFASTIRRPGEPVDPVMDARSGWLRVEYGEGGNVTSLTLRGQCADRSPANRCADPGPGMSFDARSRALADGCRCAAEQHYEYRWDELNRLSEGRRYDRGGGGQWNLVVRQRSRYDAANRRTHKLTLDDGPIRATLYVLPGDFERRGLRSRADRWEPHPGVNAEAQHLIGGARVVWNDNSGTSRATGFERDARLTYALTDLIQSTSAVLDLASGDVLETRTSYANGALETQRASDASAYSPEPMGFTGKERDDEVGLVYFGERYLMPHLGRWASADPLQVHAGGGGEFGNSYHYVSGNLLQARDPIGLCPGCRNSTGPDGRAVVREQRRAHAAAGAQAEQEGFESAGEMGRAHGRRYGKQMARHREEVRRWRQDRVAWYTYVPTGEDIRNRRLRPEGEESPPQRPEPPPPPDAELLEDQQYRAAFRRGQAETDRDDILWYDAEPVPLMGPPPPGGRTVRRAPRAGAARPAHGNSRLSTRAQHGYEIVDTTTGEVVKTGISGGRRTATGGSARANSQANRWNREAGQPGRYEPRVVKEVPAGQGARQQILEWEAENAARLREAGQLRDRTKHVRP